MRTRCWLASSAALLITITGCSALPGKKSGLEGALDRTPAGIGAEKVFYYSDLNAGHRLGALRGEQPYATAGGVGLGQLFNVARVHPEFIPTETAEAAYAVSIGQPPETSFRFVGVDSAAVEDGLAASDGQRSDLADGTLLVRQQDLQLDLEDDLSRDVQTAMNTVWYGDDVLIGSATQAHARAWVEPEESVADAGTYDDADSCLGDDVVGAMLSADADTLPTGVNAVAIATTGTSADDAVDVLCARADDAGQLLSAAESALAGGQSQQTGRPWSDILGDATIDSADGDWVRVTSSAKPGVFFTAHQTQDLNSLLGGS